MCARVHCVVLKQSATDPAWRITLLWCVGWCVFHGVSVVIALGKRPVTFRTRKLSLSAPMVLQGGPCGRVGHRRTNIRGPASDPKRIRRRALFVPGVESPRNVRT
jgi:hypothetical protein